MDALQFAIVAAALLCSLVAGFVLAFAIIVMPGIRRMADREFLRTFQDFDRIIQNNHPIFMVVWVGSIVAAVACLVLGLSQLDGASRVTLVAAATIYLAGVQLPTFTVNVPRNNRLQTLNVDDLDDEALASERQWFEPIWNRWNNIRTLLAVLASAMFIITLTLV